MESGSNMNEEDFDWDDEFDQIVGNLGNLIGLNEVNGRKYFGDSQYEKLSEMAEIASRVSLERDFASLRLAQSSARLRGIFGSVTIALVVLAFMWSAYFWVTNV